MLLRDGKAFQHAVVIDRLALEALENREEHVGELLAKLARSEHNVEQEVDTGIEHYEKIGQVEKERGEHTLELHLGIQNVDDFCHRGRKVTREKDGHHAKQSEREGPAFVEDTHAIGIERRRDLPGLGLLSEHCGKRQLRATLESLYALAESVYALTQTGHLSSAGHATSQVFDDRVRVVLELVLRALFLRVQERAQQDKIEEQNEQKGNDVNGEHVEPEMEHLTVHFRLAELRDGGEDVDAVLDLDVGELLLEPLRYEIDDRGDVEENDDEARARDRAQVVHQTCACLGVHVVHGHLVDGARVGQLSAARRDVVLEAAQRRPHPEPHLPKNGAFSLVCAHVLDAGVVLFQTPEPFGRLRDRLAAVYAESTDQPAAERLQGSCNRVCVYLK